jgi:hypothetical protein
VQGVGLQSQLLPSRQPLCYERRTFLPNLAQAEGLSLKRGISYGRAVEEGRAASTYNFRDQSRAMYQVLILLPNGKLLAGSGDSDDFCMPSPIHGWSLDVHFQQDSGKLLVRDNHAELQLSGRIIFKALDVKGGATLFVDRVDGGRHEYVYRGLTRDGTVTIGVALDTDPARKSDTAWLVKSTFPVDAWPDTSQNMLSGDPQLARTVTVLKSQQHQIQTVGVTYWYFLQFWESFYCSVTLPAADQGRRIQPGSPSTMHIFGSGSPIASEKLWHDLERSRKDLPILPTPAEREALCRAVVEKTDRLQPRKCINIAAKTCGSWMTPDKATYSHY